MLELSESKSEGGKLSMPAWLGQGCSFTAFPFWSWLGLGEQIPFGRVCSFRAGGCGFICLSAFPSWLHTFLPVPTGCVPTGPTPEPRALAGRGVYSEQDMSSFLGDVGGFCCPCLCISISLHGSKDRRRRGGRGALGSTRGSHRRADVCYYCRC